MYNMHRQRALSDATPWATPTTLSSGRWRIVSAWTSYNSSPPPPCSTAPPACTQPQQQQALQHRPKSQPHPLPLPTPQLNSDSNNSARRKRISLFLKRKSKNAITRLSMHNGSNHDKEGQGKGEKQKEQDEEQEQEQEQEQNEENEENNNMNNFIRRAQSTGITRSKLMPYEDAQPQPSPQPQCQRQPPTPTPPPPPPKEEEQKEEQVQVEQVQVVEEEEEDIIGEICLENFAEHGESENDYEFLDGQSLDLNLHGPNGDCHNVTLDVTWEDKDFDFDITRLFASFMSNGASSNGHDQNGNSHQVTKEFQVDDELMNEWKEDGEEHNRWNFIPQYAASNSNTSMDIRDFVHHFR